MLEKLTQTKVNLGDYTGDDGLLYCGKCRTPKQIRMDVNPLTREKVPTIVPTPCRCRQEADRAKEERTRLEEFKVKLGRLNASGITCPGSLRYIFADDDGQRPDTRKAAGLTQQAMADKLGIDCRYYKSLESGEWLGAICIWDKLEDITGIHQRVLRKMDNS